MAASGPAVLLLSIIPLLAACGPCVGVTTCGDAPTFATVEGQVVATGSEHAMSGVRVVLFQHASGAGDSAVTMTGADGLFSVTLPASAVTPGNLSLRVLPPGDVGYVIDSLPCAPTNHVGDACVLGPILSKTYLPLFIFEYRNDPGRRVAVARVSFMRTGGSALYRSGPIDADSSVTDSLGVAYALFSAASSSGTAPVIGDLVVELPPPLIPSVRHDYAVHPEFRLGSPPLAVQAVGPGLGYQFTFVDSVTGAARSGIEVTFERTGGIHTRPDTFTTTSNDAGVAGFPTLPLTDGTIEGTVTIRTSAGASPSLTTPFSLATFDADSSIVLRRWAVGASGALRVLPGGTP